MMKKIATILLLVLSLQNGHGFANPSRTGKSSVQRSLFASPLSNASPEIERSAPVNANAPMRHLPSTSLVGFMMGVFGLVGQAVAEDYELEALPPPYIPALFGVVLLAGVGVLTSSLGNVMDEGESRAMHSRLSFCSDACAPNHQPRANFFFLF